MIPEDGSHISSVSVLGSLDLNSKESELRFEDGRVFRFPTALLQQQRDLSIPDSLSPLRKDALVVPLVEEQLQVGKRVVETGKVHLHKSVRAYDVRLDETLMAETWKVERVPKHEVVVEAPLPRREGNTTIYPLVEERLVLTKELVIVEEIWLTRELSERRDTQTVTLRRETLNVERVPSL